MRLVANTVVKEVGPPPNLYCRSGHNAPELFRRGGTKAPEEPTKFFQVSSDGHPAVNGVYCEPCLIIANSMNQMQIPK